MSFNKESNNLFLITCFLLPLVLIPSIARPVFVEEGPSIRLTGYKGHSEDVLSLAFSPDGKLLASGGQDNMVKVWRVEDGLLLAVIIGHQGWVNSVSFSPNGKYLASGGRDSKINIWQSDNWQKLLTLEGHQGQVTSLAFSPDGKYLASGSQDNTIKIWRVHDWEPVAELKGHRDGVRGVAFSFGGIYLASASYDKTVKIWRSGSWREVVTLKGHEDSVTAVAFSPDGKRLATGGHDNTVRVWQVGDWQKLALLSGHDADVESVAFNADGEYLASAGDDGVIRLWRLSDWSEVTSFDKKDTVWQIAFSPYNKYLVSANADHTISRLDMKVVVPGWYVGKPAFYKPKDITAPLIKITHPDIEKGHPTKEYNLFVEGAVSDDSEVLWVTVNDRPAEVDPRGIFKQKVDLRMGENRFVVAAMDDSRNLARREFSITRESASALQPREVAMASLYRETWAVLIGVDEYKNLPHEQQQSNRVNDARRLARLLETHFKTDNIIELYNEKASGADILSTLRGRLAEAVEEDGVLIFIAARTHSISTPFGDLDYLVPHDGSLKDNEMHLNIPFAQLRDDILKAIPAKHVFLVLDNCYDGFSLQPAPARGEHDMDYLLRVKDGMSRLVLTAGKSGQKEEVKEGLSLFAARLTAALGDGRDFISARELASLLRQEFFRADKDRAHPQEPQFGALYGQETGDFVFLVK